MLYYVLSQEVVDLQHCQQRSCHCYRVSRGRNGLRTRGSRRPGPDQEDNEDPNPNYPQSHQLLGKVFHPQKDNQKNKEDSSDGTHPGRRVAKQPLNLKADEVESYDEKRQEAKPIDKTIAYHVVVIAIEVSQDALLNVSTPPQVDQNERGSVVAAETDQQDDQQRRKVACTEAHHGNDQPAESYQAGAQTYHQSIATYLSPSIECVLFILCPRQHLSFIPHLVDIYLF